MPIASTPHSTASGFNGSPTEAENLKFDKSKDCGNSLPDFMSMRIAVGAVYQTETL